MPSALHIYPLHTVCVHTQRDLLKSQDNNNCLPLKMRNSQNTELKSNQSEVCKGFSLALLSQMSLCDCCSCGPPATFQTINPTVIIQGVQFHQVGKGTWFLKKPVLTSHRTQSEGSSALSLQLPLSGY